MNREVRRKERTEREVKQLKSEVEERLAKSSSNNDNNNNLITILELLTSPLWKARH